LMATPWMYLLLMVGHMRYLPYAPYVLKPLGT
jgi:hypothetical protein